MRAPPEPARYAPSNPEAALPLSVHPSHPIRESSQIYQSNKSCFPGYSCCDFLLLYHIKPIHIFTRALHCLCLALYYLIQFFTPFRVCFFFAFPNHWSSPCKECTQRYWGRSRYLLFLGCCVFRSKICSFSFSFVRGILNPQHCDRHAPRAIHTDTLKLVRERNTNGPPVCVVTEFLFPLNFRPKRTFHAAPSARIFVERKEF